MRCLHRARPVRFPRQDRLTQPRPAMPGASPQRPRQCSTPAETRHGSSSSRPGANTAPRKCSRHSSTSPPTCSSSTPEYHPCWKTRTQSARLRPRRRPDQPFLHLSLHLAIEEQLSIDQPPASARLRHPATTPRRPPPGNAPGARMPGETIWEAQRSGTPLDGAAYLERIGEAGPLRAKPRSLQRSPSLSKTPSLCGTSWPRADAIRFRRAALAVGHQCSTHRDCNRCTRRLVESIAAASSRGPIVIIPGPRSLEPRQTRAGAATVTPSWCTIRIGSRSSGSNRRDLFEQPQFLSARYANNRPASAVDVTAVKSPPSIRRRPTRLNKSFPNGTIWQGGASAEFPINLSRYRQRAALLRATASDYGRALAIAQQNYRSGLSRFWICWRRIATPVRRGFQRLLP